MPERALGKSGAGERRAAFEPLLSPLMMPLIVRREFFRRRKRPEPVSVRTAGCTPHQAQGEGGGIIGPANLL
jgi:hypothetical protein